MAGWKLTPVNNGEYFLIQLAEDERRLDNTNMAGWYLALHAWYDQDKRDDASVYTALVGDPHAPNTKWKITPTANGQAFKISLAQCDTNATKGWDLTGYKLTSHRYFDQDKKNRRRTYVNFHKSNDLDNQCFRFVRDLNNADNKQYYDDSSDSDQDVQFYHGGYHQQQKVMIKPNNYQQYGNFTNRQVIYINPQVQMPWWCQMQFDKFTYNMVLDPTFDKYGQDDWYLSAERDSFFEKRDDWSTRLCLRKPQHWMTGWKITPINNGEYFNIDMMEDERRLDGKIMVNWRMMVHNFFDQDRRDECSVFGMVHADQKAYNHNFKIIPAESGKNFVIQLYGCNTEVTKGVDLNGYYLTAHRWYNDRDFKGDGGTFVHWRPDRIDGQEFRFIRDFN
jgi:type 1 fimbria pilin